jgi:two-component system LytT family response regulator
LIRIAIVDDEAPARAKVRALLADEADLEIVGEAADGPEAVALIRGAHPDLVFLDVQMPGLDGFQVLEQVIEEAGTTAMPLTIFVTAYDEHALRAFEVHAFDYLLKPFARRRFSETLRRARQRLLHRDDVAARLARLLADLPTQSRFLRRLQAERAGGREVLLPVEAIDVLRADRNDVVLVTREGPFRRRGPLKDLLARLDPEAFLQINRSEAVRLAAVRELQPWFHGDYRLVLHDGTVLTWSRRFRARDKGRF